VRGSTDVRTSHRQSIYTMMKWWHVKSENANKKIELLFK
jgi:hypothetical protein